jgi:hypothetical protein
VIRRCFAVFLVAGLTMAFQLSQRSPIESLKARIEAITRSVNAHWGIGRITQPTADYFGNR